MSVPKNPPKGIKLTGNRSRLGPGTSVLVAEIQGADTLSDHLWILGEFWQTFAPQILDVTADVGIEIARDFVPSVAGTPSQGMTRNPGGYPNFGRYATNETWDSINKSPGVIAKPSRGEWSIRYGPDTPQARLLEYGTIYMSPRPFMIPSGDAAEIVLQKSVLQFLKLFDISRPPSSLGSGADPRTRAALSDPRVSNPFYSIRTFLYSTSKFLGDIAVFGGRDLVGGPRALSISLARSLGDVNSIMSGAVGQRITNRLQGRATGRLAGFGTASLNYGQTYSGFAGGAAGHRVYQRVAGRAGQAQFSYGTSGFGLSRLLGR